MSLFFDDGDEHVGCYGAPHQRLHRIRDGAQKPLVASASNFSMSSTYISCSLPVLMCVNAAIEPCRVSSKRSNRLYRVAAGGKRHTVLDNAAPERVNRLERPR